ncbi:hypothetical protein IAR55_005879 [Kwoniella newhampshirensis]|uniref:Long chronological lifespan protein 2 n=1 Tax=Kwoniella newhampshirensis TaxID=1651941 RepID=A0AAW0YV28_9TREE
MFVPVPISFVFLLLTMPLSAFAQFGQFFQQGFPFGGHHAQHQHQQHQGGGGGGGSRQFKGWNDMAEVHCSAGYVCPASLACVPTPAECPCPYPEDVKCVIPDHRERDEGEGPPFICVREEVGCKQVVEFAKPI